MLLLLLMLLLVYCYQAGNYLCFFRKKRLYSWVVDPLYTFNFDLFFSRTNDFKTFIWGGSKKRERKRKSTSGERKKKKRLIEI